MKLKINKLLCIETTDSFLNGSTDEIYFLLGAKKSDGTTVQLRLPGSLDSDDTWDMKQGDDRDNIVLWDAELRDSEFADVYVLLMESDDGTASGIAQVFKTFFDSIPYGSPRDGRPTEFEKNADAARTVLGKLSKAFQDTDDFIGSFAARIERHADSLTSTWKLIERGEDKGSSDEGITREFRLNGDGSDYRLRVQVIN